jgi:hypothetical protein
MPRATLKDCAQRITRSLLVKAEPGPWFSIAAAALFAAGVILVHAYHELWRDEMHCWVLARNSHGFWDLLTGVRRYDGHPVLWYYLLYLVSRLSRSVVVLHGTTIVIAALSAYLWLRDVPLARVFRVSLLATYLFFFEYSVLSRSYTLGILFLFLFCRVYQRQRLRAPLLSILLVLLSLTSAYGALIAIVLGPVIYLQSLADIRQAKVEGRLQRRQVFDLVFGGAILGAGLLFAWITTYPPQDSHFSVPGMLRRARIWPTLPLRYWLASFPRCNPGNGSWMVTAAVGDDQAWLAPVLPEIAIALFLLWLVALRKAPLLALAYGLGALMMAGFQHLEYAGSIRHCGHYFVLLIACIWLSVKQPHLESPGRLLYTLLSMTLAVQVVATTAAVSAEVRLPFSGSLEAARFLRSHGLADAPLVGSFDHSVSAVTGYLDRPFRSAESYEKITSVVFSHRQWPMGAPLELPFDIAVIEARMAHTPAIVIQNAGIGPYSLPKATIEPLYVTQPAIVSNEQFWIYRVTPSNP